MSEKMKFTPFLCAAAVMCCLLFLSSSVQAQLGQQQQPKAPASLPNILLVKPDNSRIFTRDIQGPAVVVLFQPDCDHCQREATQIQKHLKAFQNYSIYFVSTASLEELEQFAEEYRLNDQPNVFFAYTDLMNILNNFGAVETPSLYIYSDSRQLVKAFNGETPIGLILQHI